jgi:hypothetical protein
MEAVGGFRTFKDGNEAWRFFLAVHEDPIARSAVAILVIRNSRYPRKVFPNETVIMGAAFMLLR